MEIVSELEEKRLSLQTHLPAKLLAVCPNFTLPNKISNLTRKVTSHIKNGGDDSLPIPGHVPASISELKESIGDLCEAAGISPAMLASDSSLDIDDKFRTKQLVFELERYRRKSNSTWCKAQEWAFKIWGTTESTSLNIGAFHSSWTNIYDRVSEIRKKRQDLGKFFAESYSLPSIKPDVHFDMRSKLHEITNVSKSHCKTTPISLKMAEAEKRALSVHFDELEKENFILNQKYDEERNELTVNT